MFAPDGFAPNRLPGNVTLGLAALSQPSSYMQRRDGNVADTIATHFYPLHKAMGTGRVLTQTWLFCVLRMRLPSSNLNSTEA